MQPPTPHQAKGSISSTLPQTPRALRPISATSCVARAPAITKIVLHTCTAQLLRVIVESSNGVKIVTETNGILGIETPSMADYETKSITLVMRGAGWLACPATYDLMAGQTALTNKETYGPLCAPNSVALTHLSAAPSAPGWMRSLLAQFIRN